MGTAGLRRLAVPWGRSRQQTGEASRYGIPAAHRRSITAPAASTPLTVLAGLTLSVTARPRKLEGALHHKRCGGMQHRDRGLRTCY